MQVKSVIILIVCCYCMTAMIFAGNDENKPDTLVIENLTVQKGQPVTVNVSFINDQQLAALTIPLKITGDGFTIDTVLFSDGRVNYLRMRPITISKDRQSVIFGAICMTEAYIQPGTGLMATLILKTDSSFTGACVIDTTTMGPSSVLFTKANSHSFIPLVKSATITVSDSVQKK
ncbi:MAG: hypothetical protein KAR42_02610 [candidate division Zixibacteria bacterium]|nr:hypothetical protein [candidate division Zixibacteria bacterium]